MEPISLYFHIPFCTKKCAYCHFYVLPDKAPLHEALMEGLKLDLALWAPALKNKQLVSIYFGGGTPALLGAAPLGELLDQVRAYLPFANDAIEITLEANPDSITPKLMREYAEVGVNRVSIGIQSLDDNLLKKLGRTHHALTALKGIEMTVEAGISNISIDLMYDIPGQTLSSWHHTLSQIQNLPITHLSLYNLTIEPHTVFFKYRDSLQKELPDAESSTQMYKDAVTILNSCGLKQYEISAFAKDECYSRHNVGYWTARPFLGFGPSAFSYWEGKRFRAVANLSRYAQALRENRSPIDFTEELLAPHHQRELFVIALRLCWGVHLPSFELKHGKLDDVSIKVLENLQIQGWVSFVNDTYKLTETGILFYDTVATELI